jgi:hypothetical protein
MERRGKIVKESQESHRKNVKESQERMNKNGVNCKVFCTNSLQGKRLGGRWKRCLGVCVWGFKGFRGVRGVVSWGCSVGFRGRGLSSQGRGLTYRKT